MNNIVCSNGQFHIYGDAVQTMDKLPVNCFDVCFSKEAGHFLTRREDLTTRVNKVFGNSPAKVEKVFKTFNEIDRNMGVMLSGTKGMGKTLFVRMTCEKAVTLGYPVLIVNDYIPALSSFIQGINQDCVVIFDEFDKTYVDGEDKPVPQNELLNLFDGIDTGHKLFIITYNDGKKISEFLKDRPGRFRYHFSMEAPDADQCREFALDRLRSEYSEVANKIASIRSFFTFTYDVLSSICDEINLGYSLDETLKDLNVNFETGYQKYDITITLANGLSYSTRSIYSEYLTYVAHDNAGYSKECTLNLVGKASAKYKNINCCIHFDDTVPDSHGGLTIEGDKVQLMLCDYDLEDDSDEFLEKAQAEFNEYISANPVVSAKLTPKKYETVMGSTIYADV